MWTFFETVDADRQKNLIDSPSFETISGALVLASDLVGFENEVFDDIRLRGCVRASFLLDVPNQLYDSFYNGTDGYRAQYAADPTQGELANRQLIDALTAKVLTEARQKFGIELEFARGSLSGQGAKIWIYEPEVHDHLFDDTPEIDFKRWIDNSEDGVGLRAPVGSKLIINGGWLDELGVERVDPYKAGRSQEIYDVGFT